MTKKIATLVLTVGMMFSLSGFASATPVVSSVVSVASDTTDDITPAARNCDNRGGCIPVIDFM